MESRLSDPNNFLVVCDGIEVDKVIGNETDLKKDSLTKLFPDSTGWFTTNTSFIFRIPQNISINQYNNTLCYVYYGNLGYTSTKNNKSNIALLYDDFNRPNSTTLNNGWVEGTGIESGDQSSLEIGNNQATVRFAGNGAANKILDMGPCSDCEKWEILFEETQKGTDGDTFYITFSNTYQPNPNVQAAISGAKGVYFYHSNFNYFAIWNMASTILKKGNLMMYNQIPIAHNVLALDDTSIGHFIDYFNNTLLTWDMTDLNDTTISTGNKTTIKLIGQRIGDSLNYIMIKRYMANPPTVTLGIEEALNTPPLISQITLTPLSPVTTDNLNCTIQAIDNEQLNLFVNISWYNNSILKFTFPNQPITNGTLTGFYLNNANTTKNENWSCSAAAFDGALWSGINYSQGIIIQNSLPAQSQPLLTATSILNSTTDNLTCYNRSTQDLDKDPVTNIYNWYKNSQPLSALNMPFETSAKDYSGRNNNGTINGSVFVQGKAGNALKFDGADDYVSVLDSNSLDITNAITIESWIKLNASAQSMILDKNLAYRLWFPDSTGKFQLSLFISGAWVTVASNSALSINNWYHIAVIYNGSAINLYINSIQDKSQPVSGLISTSTEEITIGSYKYGNYFFNGTIDEVKIYPYALSEKQIKQRYDETKDGLTTNSAISAEETTPGEAYFCQITPNDGIIDGLTLNSTEIKILWKIIFNVTSGEDGSQLLNFNINCSNSFTKTGADSPYSVGFLPGSYECNFTKGTSFYDKLIIFTADSDKIIDVKMSSRFSLTIEERNQLQAIYDCLINGNCEAYNLWKNINKTVFEIWKHELRTDRAVVTNEVFISRTLSSTQNISINYTINIPFKAGYAQGDLLPLRMFFWFHNYNASDSNSIRCYSQDKVTSSSNRAESPFCLPLVAETLGPNNGTVTFTVDLRPNLPAGTYNITRSIEIDPIFEGQRRWINYGQEIIGDINVQESTSNQPSISINQKSLKYPEIKSIWSGLITGSAIRDILTNGLSSSITFLIALIIISTAVTVVFVSYFRSRYK